MPKRRPNQEGSFYFRKRDKRWVAFFNGQTQTDRVKELAWAKFQQMKAAASAGYDHQRAKSQLATVESLCERLFHSGMSASTVTQYRAGLVYLLPYLGGTPIDKLTAADVRRWLELLDRKHAQDKTRIRQVAYDMLSRACKLAEADGLIAKNPIRGVKRPASRRKAINPPTLDEAVKIMQATTGDRESVAVALGLWAGLRPCEIFGLRWSRIDWRRKVLLVDQAAVESSSVKLQDHSKTAAAYREVPIIPQLLQVLKDRNAQAIQEGLLDAANPDADSLVISTGKGTPISRSTFLSRYWKPLLNRLGLSDRPFYSTRHSCATMLVASGIPMQVVAKIVGHRDPKTTMQTYSHVLPGDAEKVVAALSALYDSHENQDSLTAEDVPRQRGRK